MLKRSINPLSVVTLDHTAREKVALLPRPQRHALSRRLGIPKANSQIRSRVVISGGEMFERPGQRQQSRTGKTQPDMVATDNVAAFEGTCYLLGRLEEIVDGLEVLDRFGRLFFNWDR